MGSTARTVVTLVAAAMVAAAPARTLAEQERREERAERGAQRGKGERAERRERGPAPAAPATAAPDDRALQRAGEDVTNALQIERARATRLQLVLGNLRYAERLRGLADQGGPRGERAAALAGQLASARGGQARVLTARWPVDPTRVCGYPALELGAMLDGGAASPEDLAKHRAMLTGCVEQAEATRRMLKEGNDAIEAAMREADAAFAERP